MFSTKRAMRIFPNRFTALTPLIIEPLTRLVPYNISHETLLSCMSIPKNPS